MTGMPRSTAAPTAGAIATESSGLMTMPSTPSTMAASMSAVCLGALFCPSEVITATPPSSSAVAFSSFSMCTKNGKPKDGTEVMTVRSCAFAGAASIVATAAAEASAPMRMIFISVSSHSPDQHRPRDRLRSIRQAARCDGFGDAATDLALQRARAWSCASMRCARPPCRPPPRRASVEAEHRAKVSPTLPSRNDTGC